MPTVFVSGPYRFFFVFVDYSEPPHIHVQREKFVAKYWLDPIQLEKSGGFKAQELNQIARLVQEHQSYLLERWYEYFGR
jgi:hypothetical protein